jgi:hypothetical protein
MWTNRRDFLNLLFLKPKKIRDAQTFETETAVPTVAFLGQKGGRGGMNNMARCLSNKKTPVKRGAGARKLTAHHSAKEGRRASSHKVSGIHKPAKREHGAYAGYTTICHNSVEKSTPPPQLPFTAPIDVRIKYFQRGRRRNFKGFAFSASRAPRVDSSKAHSRTCILLFLHSVHRKETLLLLLLSSNSLKVASGTFQ